MADLAASGKSGNITGPRVRFAPSPSGHLHVGGARTALYNWLFARGRGGSFILRIEDTDLSRSTEESIQQIISSLTWLGLDWDEGPGASGEFGPYRQTERMDIYKEVSDELVVSGKAYRCYCSTEELETAREAAKAANRPFIYDGCCQDLSVEDRQRLSDEGRSSVIRLRTPVSGTTVVEDTIKGNVEFDNSLLGDFIIVRSSGVPTYNFAVAVDDARMKITHVIRGDDHLPNTPRQLMLFEAMGERPPVYGHLPLILGSDKAPLSKRHGASSVEEFRAQGYLKEALCNYLALLGWSLDGETTLLNTGALIQNFSLERVGHTASVFDSEKLLWMNGQYIRDLEPAELAKRIEDYLAGSEISVLAGSGGKPSIVELVPLVQEKMKTLADFVALTDFFFLPLNYEEKSLAKLISDVNAPVVLSRTAELLESLEKYDPTNLETAIRKAAEDIGLKLGKFLQPVRIALSGKMVTPGMFETLVVLGRDESLYRLRSALERIENSA